MSLASGGGELDLATLALAPRPQRITRLPGCVRVPDASTPAAVKRSVIGSGRIELDQAIRSGLEIRTTGAHCESDSASLQGYELVINPEATPAIAITAATPGGAYSGLMTLAQLLRLFPSELPAMHLRDWPAIPRRGLLLDISRTRVPTMRQLYECVDAIAELKYNHLQLYVEHTFAYANHEPAWRGCSPITPDELRRLDAYCAARGVDLAANQNCFGHLAHWLRKPEYAHLAETHGDWMFDIWPRSGPFSLCPTDPRSLELACELIAEQAACVRGPFFNINCDETYDIAFGRSRDEVARRGRLAVYTDFVCSIAACVREQGKTPMFWGDVALPAAPNVQDREQLARLRDAGLVALVWGYEPDAPFDEHLARVHTAGMPGWACPGTSCWRSITGRTTQRRANVDAACRAVVARRAPGVLLCAWGDVGHWQQWPITLHAIGQSADAMWRGRLSDVEHDRTAHGPHVFDAQHGTTIAAWLDTLGDADLPLRAVSGPYSKPGLVALRNATPIFASVHQPLATLRGIGHAEHWSATARTLRSLHASMPMATPLLHDELHWSWQFAAFSTARACRAIELHGDAHALAMLAGEHRGLSTWYDHLALARRRLWMARAREGGIDESCTHDAVVRGFLGELL